MGSYQGGLMAQARHHGGLARLEVRSQNHRSNAVAQVIQPGTGHGRDPDDGTGGGAALEQGLIGWVKAARQIVIVEDHEPLLFRVLCQQVWVFLVSRDGAIYADQRHSRVWLVTPAGAPAL